MLEEQEPEVSRVQPYPPLSNLNNRTNALWTVLANMALALFLLNKTKQANTVSWTMYICILLNLALEAVDALD